MLYFHWDVLQFKQHEWRDTVGETEVPQKNLQEGLGGDERFSAWKKKPRDKMKGTKEGESR